jgi:hypothetical protein
LRPGAGTAARASDKVVLRSLQKTPVRACCPSALVGFGARLSPAAAATTLRKGLISIGLQLRFGCAAAEPRSGVGKHAPSGVFDLSAFCLKLRIRQVLPGSQSRRCPEAQRRGQTLYSEAGNAKNAPESTICGALRKRSTAAGSVVWLVQFSSARTTLHHSLPSAGEPWSLVESSRQTPQDFRVNVEAATVPGPIEVPRLSGATGGGVAWQPCSAAADVSRLPQYQVS